MRRGRLDIRLRFGANQRSTGRTSLSVSPTGLSWTAKVGASDLVPVSMSITNTGTGLLTFAGVSNQ